MDVHRSFTTIKAIDPTAMTNVLRTYAYYNPVVEYCQGMNFIVGFLYLLLQDETTTFKFFKTLLDKFKMDNLFKQDVPLLRSYFYQMDRLIYLHYPNLTINLRNEGINSSFFTAGWFITLFTYSLQYSKEDKPSEMLVTIWDGFLLYGWKAIFKTALFIVGELEEKIVEGRFDEIMMMLGELPKSKFMNSPETAKKLRDSFSKIKVTNKMLECLNNEYTEILQRAEKQFEKPPEVNFFGS